MSYDRPLPSSAMSHLPDSSSNSSSTMNQPQVGAVEYIQSKLSQSSHPTVIVFHILFKVIAVLFYMFGGWMLGNEHEGANFIMLTVILILILAADFWVVKNVTGRLLVGLRWWNKVENDTTTWIFESAENKRVNPFDRSVFWTTLYAAPLVWGFFLIAALISFQFKWLLIVGIALALSSANVYGYYKCSGEQKARFQQMMQAGAQQGAMAAMRSVYYRP